MRDDLKIDVVITWVDGDDPQHKAKREQFGNVKIAKRDDVAGATRFRSVGEIFYCVASINRFASWVNKIYIVTDQQDPKLDEPLKKIFPNGYIPMEIVDHRVIFEGYEEYLPVFNSIAIESMTWRIPGLSEHFIEFNDDLILGAPVTPEDFFPEENEVICYGNRRLKAFVSFSRMLKYRFDGTKKVSFKGAMIKAAKLCDNDAHFIMLYHTPKALLRSVYEQHFKEHPEQLLQNIKHRFRHASQYNPEELQYLKLYSEGRCQLHNANDELFYLMAKADVEYVRRKLTLFSQQGNKKFGCFNSLDLASDEGREMVIDWIERRIGIR